MPCLIGCLALAAPRLALFLVWFFSDLIGRAYDSVMWPVLGFVFLPTTTLAYAWAVRDAGAVEGWYWVLMVLALMTDLGSTSGAHSAARDD